MKNKQGGMAVFFLMCILIGSSMTAIHIADKPDAPEPRYLSKK